MKANIFTSFAAGLLISAAACGLTYFSQDHEKSSKKDVKLPTEEEMKTTLSSSGYIILTDEEWEEQLALAKADETKPEAAATAESEQVVYRAIVSVAPGMTSIDVGKALVQGKIIDNAKTFFNEVEKRGLSTKLKPGTFELDSSMNMDQIIGNIFK